MPRIPIETAQGPRAFPQYAPHVNAPQTVDIGDVAGATQQLGQQLAQDHFKAVAQQQALEFSKVKEETDAGLVGIKNDLSVDERVLKNPQEYFPLYMERANQLYRQINGTIVSGPGAKRAHDAYFTNRLPELAVEARQYGTNLIRADNLATLDNQAEVLSNKAAVTEGAVRQEAINQYESLVDTAYLSGDIRGAGGLPDPRAREKLIRDFKNKTANKRLAYLLDTDHHAILDATRTDLKDADPVLKERYLELAVKKQEGIDRESNRVMKDVEDVVWNWALAEAYNRRLPEAYIKNVEDGKNPFIKDPAKAQALRRATEGKDRGNDMYDDTFVRAVMFDVANGSSAPNDKLARVQHGRGMLNAYVERSGGVINEPTARAMAALSLEEGRIRFEERQLDIQERQQKLFPGQVLGQERSKTHERQRSFDLLYDKEFKKSFMTSEMAGNRRTQEIADGKVMLERNPDMTPQQAIDAIKAKRAEAKKERTQREKDAEDALQGYRR